MDVKSSYSSLHQLAIIESDTAALRQITAEQLLDLGKCRICYVKVAQQADRLMLILFGADGAPVLATESIEQAAETATELGLDLFTVH